MNEFNASCRSNDYFWETSSWRASVCDPRALAHKILNRFWNSLDRNSYIHNQAVHILNKITIYSAFDFPPLV